jgi:hypothetical protein
MSSIFLSHEATNVSKILRELLPNNWIYVFDLSTIVVEIASYYESEISIGNEITDIVLDLLYTQDTEEEKLEAVRGLNPEELERLPYKFISGFEYC